MGRKKIPSRTSCWFLVPFLHLSSVWGQRQEAAFFPAPWTALSAPPSLSPLPEPRSSGSVLILLSDHSLTIGNWLLKYYRRSQSDNQFKKYAVCEWAVLFAPCLTECPRVDKPFPCSRFCIYFLIKAEPLSVIFVIEVLSPQLIFFLLKKMCLYLR